MAAPTKGVPSPVWTERHLSFPPAVTDPYFAWALETRYRYLLPRGTDERIPIIIELNGMTAQEVAGAITVKAAPDRNDVEKARRQLERLVATGHAHRQDGTKGGVEGGKPHRYYAMATDVEKAQ